MEYACHAARELPTYQAQERWLEFYGTSLEKEFEEDDMTLLLLAPECWLAGPHSIARKYWRNLVEIRFVGNESQHAQEIGKAGTRLFEGGRDATEEVLALGLDIWRKRLGLGVEPGRAEKEDPAVDDCRSCVGDLPLIGKAGEDALTDKAQATLSSWRNVSVLWRVTPLNRSRISVPSRPC